MDYRVVVAKGKTRETVVIAGCSCAGEAESKALQRYRGFSIYDIARCSDGGNVSREKISVDDHD